MNFRKLVTALFALLLTVWIPTVAFAVPIPADGVLNQGETGTYTTPVLGRNRTFQETLEFMAAVNRVEFEFSTQSTGGGTFKSLRFWFRNLTTNRMIASNVSVLGGPNTFVFNILPGQRYEIRIMAQTANTGGNIGRSWATVNVVSTIPVPPALALLLTGVLGAGVIGHRTAKKKKYTT
jgi:hypothetical protein